MVISIEQTIMASTKMAPRCRRAVLSWRGRANSLGCSSLLRGAELARRRNASGNDVLGDT
jgi:hypothetical protein